MNSQGKYGINFYHNTEGKQEIPSEKESYQFDLTEDLDAEEEFEYTNTGGENKEDDEFDQIIGVLQDTVIDPAFEEQQRVFLEKYCLSFEDEEENRMEYMDIFKEYQDKLENYIEKKLKEAKPDLNMKKFLSLVESRVDEIDPQLFDMLLTLTDFQAFKEHMLASKKTQLSMKKKSKKFEEYKQEKKETYSSLEQDFGDLLISGQSKAIYSGKLKEKDKKTTKETKPMKPTELVEKGNQNQDQESKPTKEYFTEETSHHPQKKIATKANPDHIPQQKENIFS